MMCLILLHSVELDVATNYINYVYFWKQTSHKEQVHNGIDKEQCTSGANLY
jgi:hypothetical protein